MAIPTASLAVKDDFNRANGPLGAAWTLSPFGGAGAANPPAINSNRANNSSSVGLSGFAHWNGPGGVGSPVLYTECEVVLPITSYDTSNSGNFFYVLAGLPSGAYATSPVYQFLLSLNANGLSGNTTLARGGGNTWTSGAINFTLTSVVGAIMLRVVPASAGAGGHQVQGWLLDSSLGVWFRQSAVNDATMGNTVLTGQVGFGFGTTNSSVSSVAQSATDFSVGIPTTANYGFADAAYLAGVRPTDIGVPVMNMPTFHEGNVVGVLPSGVSEGVTQHTSHRGWIGGAAGVSGV